MRGALIAPFISVFLPLSQNRPGCTVIHSRARTRGTHACYQSLWKLTWRSIWTRQVDLFRTRRRIIWTWKVDLLSSNNWSSSPKLSRHVVGTFIRSRTSMIDDSTCLHISLSLLIFLSSCPKLLYLVISSGLFSYLYDHERVWSMALDLPVVCSPWRLVAGAEILSLKILFCLVRARHLFIHSVRACEQKTIQFSKTRKHPPPPGKRRGGGGGAYFRKKSENEKRRKKKHKGSQFFFDGLYRVCPISFFFF